MSASTSTYHAIQRTSQVGVGLGLLFSVLGRDSQSAKIPLVITALSAIGWLYSHRAIKKIEERRWALQEDMLKKEVGEKRVEQVKTALDKANIFYVVTTQEEWPQTTKTAIEPFSYPKVDLFSAEKEILWENADVSIQLRREYGYAHLWVEPKETLSLQQITPEAFHSLKTSIHRLSAVFYDVFGDDSYAEELVVEKERFGFEIYPGASKQAYLVDLLAKDKRNLYMFSQGKLGRYGVSEESIGKLRQPIRKHCSSSGISPPMPFPSSYYLTQLSHSGAFRVNTLLRIWALQKRCVVQLKPFEAPSRIDSSCKKITVGECVFCKPEVIQGETIYEGTYLRIMFNFRPYVGRGEQNSRLMLFVTKRHVERAKQMHFGEISEELEFFNTLHKVMDVLFPNMICKIWRQNGVSAGHTVPHTHTQIMIFKEEELSNYFIQMLCESIGQGEPIEKQPSKQFAELFAKTLAQNQQTRIA